MAQYKKEEIRKRLLEAARAEFLEHGFREANMRAIARRAGQNPGNIYHYYPGKDALFRAVLEKVLRSVESGILFMREWKPTPDQPVYTLNEERQVLHAVIDFVDDNREDVNMLVFKSHGSGLEGLQERLLDEMTVLFSSILKEVVSFSNGELSSAPSQFFLRRMNAFFLDGLTAMLRENISKETMYEYIEEMLVFYYHGLFALLKTE